MTSSRNYTDPTPLGSNGKLTPEQVTSWRKHGYTVVDGLLSDEFARQVAKEAAITLEPLTNHNDFGSMGKLEFPSGMHHCDNVTLHLPFMKAAAQLLDVPVRELRLCQSDIWMKTGVLPKPGVDNNRQQRMHCDYGNNSLVHPPSWDAPEVVAMLIYYSEESEVGGATALAPREGEHDPAYQWPLVQMPGIGGIPFFNDKDMTERWMKENKPEWYEFRQTLYSRERHVRYHPGTVLFYRHDIFHRGTPVNPGACRFVQNLSYRRADAEWVTCWNHGFARNMYATGKMTMEYIVGRCTVDQLTVLGFPAPGHRYWNPQTLKAVHQRYAAYGFDITAYTEAYTAPMTE